MYKRQTFYLPPTTFRLPPTTFYLLPSTFYLLLHTFYCTHTFYLLPSTFRLLPQEVEGRWPKAEGVGWNVEGEGDGYDRAPCPHLKRTCQATLPRRRASPRCPTSCQQALAPIRTCARSPREGIQQGIDLLAEQVSNAAQHGSTSSTSG